MKKRKNQKLQLNRETVLMLAKREDLAQVLGGAYEIRRTAATCEFNYCTQFPDTLNCA